MNETKEALILLAKCAEQHKTYGIRSEKVSSNHWRNTWAFPIKESSAKREGYDKTSISGIIEFAEDYPGCPYCGGKELILCSCGHLNCTITKNGLFTCEWCGAQGTVGTYNGETINASMDL